MLCRVQEAAREREIEERERKLGALMAEKGSLAHRKKGSKVHNLSQAKATKRTDNCFGHLILLH